MTSSLLLPFHRAQKRNVIPNSSRAIRSFPIRSSPRRMPDDEPNVSLALAKFFLPARCGLLARIYSLKTDIHRIAAFPIPSTDREEAVNLIQELIRNGWALLGGSSNRQWSGRSRARETASSTLAGRSAISIPLHRRMTNSILSQHT